MASLLQRKYIDLICQASSKWVNRDPLIGIRVGSYGTIDKETGDLIVEGNIYDPDFQRELDRQNIKFNLANYLPQEGPIEADFIVASRGAKRTDLNADIGLNNAASVQGQWSFKRGKRDAVLILNNPRQICIPPNVVLEPLYKVDKLIDKWLVTSIHVCPAYSMYLSDKSGDKVSLVLNSQGVTGVTAGGKGDSDAQSSFLRNACDQTGKYVFTPLYSLRRPIKRNRRWIRDTIRPDPTGDDLWFHDSPPWDPLDEDGEEDLFDPSVRAVDPFQHVNDAAAAAAAAAAST